MKKPRLVNKHKAVESWNAARKPEYQARYWMGLRDGEGKVGTVLTEAMLLNGHTPVVYIRGAGAVALTHVEPLEGGAA